MMGRLLPALIGVIALGGCVRPVVIGLEGSDGEGTSPGDGDGDTDGGGDGDGDGDGDGAGDGDGDGDGGGDGDGDGDGDGEPLLCEEVPFVDSDFEQTVREQLGLADALVITGEHMAQLDDLQVWPGGGADLSGIECAVNLESLWLANAEIVALTPLEGLPALTIVELEKLQLDGPDALSFAATLPSLNSLSIVGASAPDLTPLAELADHPSFIALRVEDSGLVSLSSLAGLDQLQTLSLGHNEIVGLEALSGLEALLWLELSYNPIEDLSPLGQLPMLAGLAVTGTQVTDLGPLVSVPTLEELDANELGPYALVPAQGLSPSFVNLSGDGIADFTPMLSWAEPERWDLSNNEISDLSPLLQASWPLDEQCFTLLVAGNPLDPETTSAVAAELCDSKMIAIDTGEAASSCQHPNCPLEP